MFRTAVLIIVLISFVSIKGKAQSQDYLYYDSLTYQLYLEKDYQSLLKTGGEAVDLGFDGYYLPMRTGIAAFELKMYRVAAGYFELAKVYSDNDLVNEYLYYSYLWGDEKADAQMLKGTMSESLRDKISGRSKHNLTVDFAAATMFNSKDSPANQKFPEVEGFQVIPDHFTNASLSIKHRLGRSIKLTHTFTYLNKGNEKYTYSNAIQLYDSTFNTNQFQYYLGSEIWLANSWSLNVGGHFSSVSFPGTIIDTTGSDIRLYDTNYRVRDFILSASILKDFNRFSLEGEVVWLNLNRNLSFQPSLIVRLYPFANLNLYTQSRFSLLMNDNTTSFFQQQKIGFKVLSRLWLEGSYFSGNVSGFALNKGALLFNGLEEVNRIWGADAIVTVSQNVSVALGYQFRKQSNYFFPQADGSAISNKIEMNYSLFYIKLSWAL